METSTLSRQTNLILPAVSETVYLGLGGNQGDVLKAFNQVLDFFTAHPQCSDVRMSTVYETEPWGNPNQPNFLNAAIRLKTSLTPDTLLSHTQQLEANAGRIRPPAASAATERWGPRPLDIDILLYGNQCIEQPHHLIIPHPRMHERKFVLEPLTELLPGDWQHPKTLQTAHTLLHSLSLQQ